jgi:hypothetical protein
MQTIKIGENRDPEMSRWKKVNGTMPHEATHAIKSVQGRMQNEPALSTGVFTRNESGDWVSYLEYEEGSNKIGESLLMDDLEAETVEDDYVYHIMSTLVYRGMDDRQVAEIIKKLILIDRLTQDPALEIESQKNPIAGLTTTKLARIFRGTPCRVDIRVDGHMPIYTKDLGYFFGNLIAIKSWNDVAKIAMQSAEPQQTFHQEFERRNKGKFDPSEPTQNQLVL